MRDKCVPVSEDSLNKMLEREREDSPPDLKCVLRLEPHTEELIYYSTPTKTQMLIQCTQLFTTLVLLPAPSSYSIDCFIPAHLLSFPIHPLSCFPVSPLQIPFLFSFLRFRPPSILISFTLGFHHAKTPPSCPDRSNITPNPQL